MAKILEERDILGRLHAVEDAIDDLDAAGRADPARRAFAAAFDRAKLHREPRHPRHVDGIVENDQAAVADESVERRKSLVIIGRIEQRARKIGAKRAADLNGAHRAAASRSAADVVDQLTQRNAEPGLKQTAMLDIGSAEFELSEALNDWYRTTHDNQ